MNFLNKINNDIQNLEKYFCEDLVDELINNIKIDFSNNSNTLEEHQLIIIRRSILNTIKRISNNNHNDLNSIKTNIQNDLKKSTSSVKMSYTKKKVIKNLNDIKNKDFLQNYPIKSFISLFPENIKKLGKKVI